MTLSTLINFLDPVDPEKLFGLGRQIIGIPSLQPFEIERGGVPSAPGDYNTISDAESEVTRFLSKPGGYSAMFWLTIVPSGNGDFAKDHESSCVKYQDECDCRRWYAQVDLDTAYGYRPCCTCLHYGIIRQLVPQIEAPFEWCDEYTGDWYSCLPPERCESHGGVLAGLAEAAS